MPGINKTYLLFLLAFLILTLSILIGLALWPEEASRPQAPAPVLDPTAGWKTYRNNEYRYEIKYPPDWKLKVRTDLDYPSRPAGSFMVISAPKEPEGYSPPSLSIAFPQIGREGYNVIWITRDQNIQLTSDIKGKKNVWISEHSGKKYVETFITFENLEGIQADVNAIEFAYPKNSMENSYSALLEQIVRSLKITRKP